MSLKPVSYTHLLAAGAVPAGPGEFTRRAFLNGKMDLTQAESVMQLIGASGEQAARAAEAASSGVLSRKIGRVRQALLGLAAHLAAWADFPEEEVPEVEDVYKRQISYTRWCSPLGPVEPIYMPGRFRTASRPSST